MMQRRLRNELLNDGFSSTVSLRALIILEPIAGSFAQEGMSPQRNASPCVWAIHNYGDVVRGGNVVTGLHGVGDFNAAAKNAASSSASCRGTNNTTAHGVSVDGAAEQVHDLLLGRDKVHLTR